MSKIKLGWEEWLALPDLNLDAIKAKVDTGARTSALHAFAIEPFGAVKNPKVRFGVHPIPGRTDLEIFCTAPVVDRREVTSSNGERELRFVISSAVHVDGRKWPIEISLTDRSTMNYCMLLGRQALDENTVVEPNSSFLQPELSYDVYRAALKKQSARTLRIALLTRQPDNYSCQQLIAAGEARGHTIEAINTSRCYMNINAHAPDVYFDGKTLPRYDAVIPRIGTSITKYGMSVLRQFETMGAYCLNPAHAVGASRDKLFAHQILARSGIDMPVTAFARSTQATEDLIKIVGGAPLIIKLLESAQGKGVVLAETKKAAEAVIEAFRRLRASFLVQEFIKEADGADIRCLVVGKKVVASIQRQAKEGDFRSNLHQGGTATLVKISKEEREIAVKAARVIGLAVAGVDIIRSASGPKVLEVNSSPGLEGVEKISKKDVAGLIIGHVEKNVRSVVRTGRGTF
jgi:ribosomal protein S6--L-glutamate ligase